VGLVKGSSREEILSAQKDSPFPKWFRAIFPLLRRDILKIDRMD
jgi:hypothetical protein